MSDFWWNELCKGWPGARKIKEKSVANINESIHAMVKTQNKMVQAL